MRAVFRALLPAAMALVVSLGGRVWGQPAEGLHPEERIVITKGATSRIRILLEEFLRGPGATVEDTRAVFSVVSNDLDFSDLFSITTVPRLAPGDTVARSQARFFVRGEVDLSGGNLVLRGSLESLPGRSLVFSRDYRTRPEWYRQAAHRFADDVVLYLTGEQGIADTRIAFVSDRSGSKEIYVVDYDGHGLRRLTHTGAINLSPRWSPDGSSIVFVSYQGGDPDLYLLDVTTGEDHLLVGGQGVQSAPAFSPDGRRVAFNQTANRRSEIYLCDPAGHGLRRITRAPGINTSPTWSPDGRRLAFTSDRAGTPQVYIMDADGTNTRRLTFTGKWNDLADWSPRGDRILYTSRRGGLFRIAATGAGGLEEERQITFGPGSDEHPDWAPDGRHAVFTSTRGGEKGLYVLTVDTGRIRPLVVGGGNHYSPSWSGVPTR